MSSNLVNRLRGIYTLPVDDGAGLLDDKDTFTRGFPTPPIMHEAAMRIEELEASERILKDLLQSEYSRWLVRNNKEPNRIEYLGAMRAIADLTTALFGAGECDKILKK